MPQAAHPSLEDLLEQARHRIQVTDAELDEARRRREAIANALLREFPGSRAYFNGSVAHGDALTPLTDIDLGVVIAEALHTHGPGKRGPLDLMERAAAAIRRELKGAYPKLTVQVDGCKRAVLVRFGDPVHGGEKDFTADIICAVDNLTGEGLYIPKVPTWSRSHPEAHTQMVLEAIENTAVVYAWVVRLLKHWNRRNGKPLCSWNIKALALGCIFEPMTQLAGLSIWFEFAADELEKGETADPARVAEKPIKLNKPRAEVVTALRHAGKRLDEAIGLEKDGYPLLAHDELAKLFNDEQMLPRPDQRAVVLEEARRFRAGRANGVTTGTGAGAQRARIPAKSWAP
ncbi:nucleotidyltransferase [Blastococcus sp. CT_GayMR19]|jgi:predicted nucleotidyltransferase|uniref:nucleotidyltransferase n=1 Tax=Blastococcus sp. CT_GayMR19 TaxID=2559608 RepID=UPI0010742937|nr:nucleotidyltransferase [Blastococcus sp. CT_GayMR19]TFV79415.1 nucleotidyltransferase [Blastococcus sp. CT_GayMR19]